MKPEEYLGLIQVAKVGEMFAPANEVALQLNQDLEDGEIAYLKQSKSRDIKFHRAYFSLLNYIYDYLPNNFKKEVSQSNFYTFLKYLRGEIKILFEFKDGLQIIEPVSISFAKMDEAKFKDFIRQQLPYIYSDVIEKLYSPEKAKDIIFNIENEYEKFLSILNSKK
jgi:hypothetical protein